MQEAPVGSQNTAQRLRHRRSTRIRALFMLLVLVLLGGTLTLFVARSHAASQAVYYVSPTGSDSNNGQSPGSAFATVAHARDVVRTINSNMSGDIIVNLLDGTYTQTQTLAFTSADSGTNGHNVIYQAYNYGTAQVAHPVISGGRQVTGWTLHDSSKNIWQASIGTGVNFRQLYVNGARANRAADSVPVTLTTTSTGYTASDATLASWGNPSDIEFVYERRNGGDGYQWTSSRCDVSSISGTTITMDEPCFNAEGGNGQKPADIENAYELLTQQGQWYFNRSNGIVYYIPRPEENLSTATVIAPVLDTLFTGTGTLDAPIHNIQFLGISFAYATWMGASSNNGFVEGQANIQAIPPGTGWSDAAGTSWHKIPTSVSLHAAHNLRFERDSFVHLGAGGIGFEYGSQNNTVIGSVVADVSGNGVMVGDVNDYNPTDTREINSGNQIVDNWIHDVAVEFRGGVGIWQGFTQNSLIAHNWINNLPYSGISSGWGWSLLGGNTIVQGNQIKNNLIENTMAYLQDGGPIYTLGRQGPSVSSGMLIDGNFIDTGDGKHLLYTDDGSSNATLQNNVLYGGSSAGGASNCNSPNPITNEVFQNNYWSGPPAASDWLNCQATINSVTLTNNTTITSPSPQAACDAIPACVNIRNNAGIEPAYQDIVHDPVGPQQCPSPSIPRAGWTASPDGIYGTVASNAIDGRYGTLWDNGGQGPGDNLEVDMGSVYSVCGLRMLTGNISVPWAYSNWYPVSFSVQVSTTGASGSWTTVANGAEGSWNNAVTLLSWSAVNARYINIVITVPHRLYPNYWEIWELWFYGSGGGGGTPTPTPTATPTPTPTSTPTPTPTPTSTPTGGCTNTYSQSGWTASASGNSSSASQAIDGNTNTYWTSGGAQRGGEWFEVNLGSSQSFCKITLLNNLSATSGDYPRGYQVFVSNDGQNWGSAIASGVGNTGTTTISFSTQSAQYIKVVQTGSDNRYWWSIDELNVYHS